MSAYLSRFLVPRPSFPSDMIQHRNLLGLSYFFLAPVHFSPVSNPPLVPRALRSSFCLAAVAPQSVLVVYGLASFLHLRASPQFLLFFPPSPLSPAPSSHQYRDRAAVDVPLWAAPEHIHIATFSSSTARSFPSLLHPTARAFCRLVRRRNQQASCLPGLSRESELTPPRSSLSVQATLLFPPLLAFSSVSEPSYL